MGVSLGCFIIFFIIITFLGQISLLSIFGGNAFGDTCNVGHLWGRLGQWTVAQIHQKGPVVDDTSA